MLVTIVHDLEAQLLVLHSELLVVGTLSLQLRLEHLYNLSVRVFLKLFSRLRMLQLFDNLPVLFSEQAAFILELCLISSQFGLLIGIRYRHRCLVVLERVERRD